MENRKIGALIGIEKITFTHQIASAVFFYVIKMAVKMNKKVRKLLLKT